jgi:hypothetical protein
MTKRPCYYCRERSAKQRSRERGSLLCPYCAQDYRLGYLKGNEVMKEAHRNWNAEQRQQRERR